MFMRPADNLCPLKIGDKLLIRTPDGAFNTDVQFRFDVALYEPDVVKPEPMLEIVQRLADLVKNTVISFKPLFT
jgi:hypothetical protein